MPIEQDRLLEIRSLAEREDIPPFRVHSREMLLICDELLLSRERFGAVSGGAGDDLDRGLLYKPTPVETLAERLAKVEDRQASLDAMFTEGPNRLNRRQERLDDRIDNSEKQTREATRKLDERITKVVEIIGERISGLVDQDASLEKQLGEIDNIRAFEVLELKQRLSALESRTVGLQQVGALAAFPTGSADTAEAAADAVLPVPQRGDRVRLEGAKTLAFYSVPDGWYDVAGQNGDAFQIRVPQFGGDWLPYIPNANEGLKEVRHAENNT